ncbi:MAG: allophanate hydrolase, partial [Pseudomonadota bacterium]|nr:allophanate hydrolase [Pseudomonadota bacterium]
AVCGAHMADLPLNYQLTSRGAEFIEATESAAKYRLYALAGGPPMRPGMVRVNEDGRAIKLEIWRMPAAAFASFVELIPSPLGIGTVETASGKRIPGFICEQAGLIGATDITEFGGWRSFLASKAVSSV